MKENPQIDEILNSFAHSVEWCVNTETLFGATIDRDREADAINQAKQALASLIKELVEEAKPEVRVFDDGINDATYFQQKIVDQFEQNLLKAVEEV